MEHALADRRCVRTTQVYGDQEQHRVPRAAAADYMEVERAWFGSFVVGDASEFDEYVAGVRRDGVWGDDPEIQVRFRNDDCWAACPLVPSPKFFVASLASDRPCVSCTTGRPKSTRLTPSRELASCACSTHPERTCGRPFGCHTMAADTMTA